MKNDYLIVHKKILPEYMDKVIQARELLESKEVKTVTEAVRKAGISRNTYYKYKDYVFSYKENTHARYAVVSLILKDERGALSSLISALSQYHASILTISQALPVNGKANVLMSLDISSLAVSGNELIEQLKKLHTVKSVHLDAVE